jgi:hypothetical protein
MRYALAFFGFVAVFFSAWWMSVICMIVLSLRYRAWEVPVMGLCMDLLWMHGVIALPVFTLGALVIVWITEPIRSQLLFP